MSPPSTALRVAVCANPPLSEDTESVIRELRERGHHVELIEEGAPEGAFDVGWARSRLFLAEDGGLSANHVFESSRALADRGVPFLNSPDSVEIAIDKIESHYCFAEAGLRQPITMSLDRMPEALPPEFGGEAICKPIRSSRALGVSLVYSIEEAMTAQEEIGVPCMISQRIYAGRLLRVIASPERCVAVYEKRPSDPNQLVISIANGATRVPAQSSDAIAEMATTMVRSVGGGLMGVDILEDRDGQLWALEINAGFAFDPEDGLITRAVCESIEAAAERRE